MTKTDIYNYKVKMYYRNHMCMKHTIEIYTPIEDELVGEMSFYAQTLDNEAHRAAMKDINERISEILQDNLRIHVGSIRTVVVTGDPAHLDDDDNIATELCLKYKQKRRK